MTYFGFLIRFVFLPIFILAGLVWYDKKRGMGIQGFQKKTVWTIIGVHILLAVLYTTPWDNYLVATGVWSYNPQLVTGIIFGWVPLEEYIFFVAETLLCGLWWLFLAARIQLKPNFIPSKVLRVRSFFVLLTIWILFVIMLFSGWRPGTYVSVTFFWVH